MHIYQIRAGILILVFGVSACGGGSDKTPPPGKTVFSQRGDTVVASSAGRMPDSLVHHLVEELRIGAATGAEEEMFGRINEIAVSQDGHMLVLDGSVPVVRLYDSTGALVRQVGRKGGGPGEYGNINGLTALPDGGWAIWDASGARINTYSADGAYRTTARSPIRGFGTVDALRSDHAGNLYLRASIPDSTLGGSWKSVLVRLDSALTVGDTIPLPDWGVEPVQLIAEHEGARAIYSMPFSPRTISEWSPSGHFVSGAESPYEIHSETASGAPLLILREIPRISVPEEVRGEEKARTTWGLRLTVKDWEWNGPEIPSFKPAFVEIKLGAHDRIWVRLSTESEPIPEDELTVSNRPNAPPTMHWRNAPDHYDVFEPDGTYLGEIAMPARVRVMKVDGDNVWAVTLDDDDVQYVSRFRVEPPLGG